MTNLSDTELFTQLHIDVARNATDDFNLFHDSKKWQYIKNNPFNGTIVLGFQLESLIEHKVLLYRQLHKEQILISDKSLRFSNYQFSFVNTVKPRQLVSVEIKESQLKEGENTTLSKRKFINISNAKNFLCGSLVDQDDYFDEIHYKAIFPEIFPCSLIFCALLEKAQIEQHDFEQKPMVYLESTQKQ